ncbi:MAG: hypothetical protein SW833_20090 [Cyanobacteriota bacterium]|nr:hypothetical protein [Cyanobacteriota bacterium]
MDNFILWNISYDDKINQLSFFATNTQIQRINKGTHEMISEMLNDLGISEAVFEQWEIDFFVTDYLMDFPLSDNWKEIWSDTWEIKLQLLKSIRLKYPETELVRSFADDATWKGESLQFPVQCIVVADFYNFESLMKAKAVLGNLKSLREDVSFIDEIHSQLPNVSKWMLSKTHEACRELNKYPDKNSNALSFYQRVSNPLQFIVNIGFFGEEFFIDDTPLACFVSEIVRELEGTPTWDEKNYLQTLELRKELGLSN